MQKILIGVNTDLYASQELVNMLIKDFGHDYMYWHNYIYSNKEEFRTNPDIQKWFEKHNFTIPSEFNDEGSKYKIVEIPDDVKWHIRSHECSTGEYIAENFRTWS